MPDSANGDTADFDGWHCHGHRATNIAGGNSWKIHAALVADDGSGGSPQCHLYRRRAGLQLYMGLSKRSDHNPLYRHCISVGNLGRRPHKAPGKVMIGADGKRDRGSKVQRYKGAKGQRFILILLYLSRNCGTVFALPLFPMPDIAQRGGCLPALIFSHAKAPMGKVFINAGNRFFVD